jgi:hypothetical protein
LVDQAESPSWVGEVGGRPVDVLGRTIFVCSADLEDEYCRGIGAEQVARRLMASGEAPQEKGILLACGVSTVEDLDGASMAKFCRVSKRKVAAALAVSGPMTAADASNLGAVTKLIDRLAGLSR